MSSNKVEQLKCWLNRKWETAEEWLPWFLGLTSASVLIVGVVVGFMQSNTRKPAGFVEISDSETPAGKVYADESIESLNGTAARKSAAIKAAKHEADERLSNRDERKEATPRALVVTLKERVSDAEIFSRTGIPSVRSRAVVLSTQSLERKTGVEIRLKIELFNGLSPIFQMKSQSAYDVNTGILSGTALDDPNSRADISYESGMVSGSIVYQGKSYRIVGDPTRGLHYVVEVKPD